MTPAHGAAALMVMLIWGVNFPVAKIAVAEMPPLFFMALRFALVALLLVPFVALPRGKLREIGLLAVTLGFIHFSLMFTGIAYVDAALASVLIQIQVPFAVLLAAILFGDRLGWRRLVGMAAAIGGIAILAGSPRGSTELWAAGLIIVSALVWAIANIQIKRLSDVNAFALNGWMGLFAAPMLLAGSLVIEDGQRNAILTASWAVWGAVFYQSVLVVILCYGIWHWLLGRYRVNQTMPWTLLVPLFGVTSSVLLLGEPLTWRLVLGGATTIAGVAIILIRRPAVIDSKAQNI